jgi:DnaA family protein
MIAPQLALHFRLDEAATLDNFLRADNATAVAALTDSDEPFVYLWGEAGTGKSHLLQAACHAAGRQQHTAIYLPLAAEPDLNPQVLTDLEQAAQVICIDDLQTVAGDADWERSLFNLFNRARDNGARLLIAADASPGALALNLPDLASRLSWGTVFRLKALGDKDKVAALQLRAEARGLQLSDDVARFLLSHATRDMHSLFALLVRLDEASLRAQRKLTIPFVRQFL